MPPIAPAAIASTMKTKWKPTLRAWGFLGNFSAAVLTFPQDQLALSVEPVSDCLIFRDARAGGLLSLKQEKTTMPDRFEAEPYLDPIRRARCETGTILPERKAA